MSKTKGKPTMAVTDRRQLRRALYGTPSARFIAWAVIVAYASVGYELHGVARYLFWALAVFNLAIQLFSWGPKAKRALYRKWIIGAEFQRRAIMLSLDGLDPDAYIAAAGPMTDRERDVLLQGCSFTLMKVRELVGKVEEDLADVIE